MVEFKWEPNYHQLDLISYKSDEIPFFARINGVDYPVKKEDDGLGAFVFEINVNVEEPVDIEICVEENRGVMWNPEQVFDLSLYKIGDDFVDVDVHLTDNYTITIEQGLEGYRLSKFNFKPKITKEIIVNVENYPYINIYNIGEAELDELAETDLPETAERRLDDYIVRLNRIPFNIDEGTETRVNLGGQELPINAEELTNNIQKVDLGKIRIPKRKHQEIGYKNIQILLYAPYFEPIQLETEYYLGSEIQLYLSINLLSGMGTLNVYNSKLDSDDKQVKKIDGDEWVSYTKQASIGEEIPYEIGNGINSNIGVDTLLTDYTIPYVEVKTLVPDNEVDYRKNELIEIDKTRDYMKTNKVFISGKLSIDEQKEIRSLVSNGILINKER